MPKFQILNSIKNQWDTVPFEFFLAMFQAYTDIPKSLRVILFTDGVVAELHMGNEFLIARFSGMNNFENFMILLSSQLPISIINLTILNGKRTENFVLYSGSFADFIQTNKDEDN